MTRPAASGGLVVETQRLETAGVLRGFALLWIFTFNAFVFCGHEFLSPDQARALPTHSSDAVIKFLRHLFIENKDLAMFSFFFGLGFAWMSGGTGEGSVVSRFLRQQAVLLLLGLCHATLLWGGDVLVIYALLGLFVLLFLHAPPRTILRAAIVIYMLPIPLYALSMLLELPDPYTLATAWTGQPNLYSLWMDGFAKGGYVEVIRGNLAFLALWWAMFTVNLYWPDVIGMLLVGLYAGRTRLFERLEADPSILPGRIIVGAGVIGLAGNVVFAVLTAQGAYYPPGKWGLVLTLVQYTTVPLLCFFYLAGLAWLYQRAGWRRLLRPLMGVGRMTLTNYLMQSLICILIFYGLGGGLFGKVGPTVAVPIAWAVFAVQVLWSRWWWSRGFAFGPVEWLWRRWSYGGDLPWKARLHET